MFRVELRFYEELNRFLPRPVRKRSFETTFSEPRSVKDLIESQGVPHTEVDLILVNGQPEDFGYRVRDGDRISVYPTFESIDISGVSGLRRPPLRQPRFLADVHLGKLARRLGLLGFDCELDGDADDAELARRSAREHRILLTRDRGLLKRAVVTHGMYLHSDVPDRQTVQVLRRLDLAEKAQPFSRCLRCNGDLRRVPAASVRDRVPRETQRVVETFYRCDSCGHVYWKGAHWRKLQHIVETALARARA